MRDIRTVGLLGAGVIGAGWAARCALNGLDVRLYDPDPQAERRLGEVLENARRSWQRMTLAPPRRQGSIELVATPEAAVEGADWVQESAPEREDLKRQLLARASRAATADVIFGSSTSGLLPSRLQAEMLHPQRLVAAHPFNPVYLLPLVEVCAGEATAPDTVTAALAFYASLGMHPLHVRKEIDGFIADRLMEALWREALWLLHDDVATAAEIDDAVRFGPGLRWAFMGTYMIYRIGGGEAGMRHFMSQFGPSLKWPWTKLTEVPELDEILLEKIVTQSDAQAGGADVRALERLRDDCLVAVMQGLKGCDQAAGAVLGAFERTLFDAAHGGVMADDADIPAPLALHRARVSAEWLDYNGHMNESRYLQVFCDASDALLRYVGVDMDYVAAGRSYYTVETHIMHKREARADTPLRVTTQVLAADDKRLHVFHRLLHEHDRTVLASAEQMFLHVDTDASRACPADPQVQRRLQRIARAHAKLARPQDAGRAVGAGH